MKQENLKNPYSMENLSNPHPEPITKSPLSHEPLTKQDSHPPVEDTRLPTHDYYELERAFLSQPSQEGAYEPHASEKLTAHVRKERSKARDLKKSQWWLSKLAQGICQLCLNPTRKQDLTMEHLVPLARGGRSTKNNVMIACKTCNQKKQLDTPVDAILKSINNLPNKPE